MRNEENEKKVWEKPELVEHGDIADITSEMPVLNSMGPSA